MNISGRISRKLDENAPGVSRRDVLKTGVAGVLPTVGGPSQLLRRAFVPAANKFARQIAAFKASGFSLTDLGDTLFNIANGMGRIGPDGSVVVKWDRNGKPTKMASKDVITGALASEMSEDSNAWLFNITGDNPANFDKYDGVLSTFLKSAHETLGSRGLVRSILGIGSGRVIDVDQEFYALSKAIELIPDLSSVINIGPLLKSRGAGARELLHGGFLDKSEAVEMIRNEAESNAFSRSASDERLAADKRLEAHQAEYVKRERERRLEPVDHWADDGGAVHHESLAKRISRKLCEATESGLTSFEVTSLRSGKFIPDVLFDLGLPGRTFFVFDDGRIFDGSTDDMHSDLVAKLRDLKDALIQKWYQLGHGDERGMLNSALRDLTDENVGVYDGRWANIDGVNYMSFWTKPDAKLIRHVINHYGLDQVVCSGLSDYASTPKNDGDTHRTTKRPMKRSPWVNPGQKLWAMNSEEFNVELGRVFGESNDV